jgi:hypothetical protein
MANGNGSVLVFFLLNTAAYIVFAINLFDPDYKISEDVTTMWTYFASILFFLGFLFFFLFRETKKFLDSYALQVSIISLIISLVLDFIISARLSLERVCKEKYTNPSTTQTVQTPNTSNTTDPVNTNITDPVTDPVNTNSNSNKNTNTNEKDCKEDNILLMVNSYSLIIIKTFTLVFITYLSCPQTSVKKYVANI